MTPETAQAVAELAEDSGLSEDEVLANAVTCWAILRTVLWTPAPGLRAQEGA